MIKEKIAEVIKERIRICEETQDNWGDGIEQCWKNYVEIITSGLKGNRHIPDGKKIFGVYKGVRVGVIRTNGKIATVFPDANQNKRR